MARGRRTERAPRDRSWLPAPSWCDVRRALSSTLLLGVQTARQRWSSGASRSRPSRLDPGPPHTTLTTWRPEGRHPELEHHGAAAITRPDELDDDETTNDPPHTPATRPGVLSALILLPSSAWLLPVFCSAPLPAPAGSFQKRGVPPFQCLAHPSLSLRPPLSSCGNLPEGGRSLVPTPHSTNRPLANDLHRPSPTPSAEKLGGKNPRTIGGFFLGLFTRVSRIPSPLKQPSPQSKRSERTRETRVKRPRKKTSNGARIFPAYFLRAWCGGRAMQIVRHGSVRGMRHRN